MILLYASLALGQAGPDAAPTGRVTAATVYSDRATVTRELKVALQAGENEVVFGDLPANLDTYTLQADGSGVATIRGLSVERVELATDRRARVEAIQAQIAAKADERQARVDDQAAAQAELSFLQKLGAASASQLSAELLFSPDTTSDANALAALIHQRTANALTAVRVAGLAIRDTDASISALQRELAATQGAPQWARHVVSVLVAAPEATTANVTLSYTVPGPSWTPTWDARADLSADTLAMTLSAQVVQTTGEDWSGATLTLSTARPSAGVMAPVLSPFWLTAPYYARPNSWGGAMESAAAPAPAMDEDSSGEWERAEEPLAPMLIQEAQVIEQAVASTFVVPGGTSIRGDGTRRKVQVITVQVPTTWTHVAVPLLDERAWLVGEGTWPETWSLLAGTVNVFANDSFVGTMNLPIVGSGSTFELGFGPDDAVSVKRTVLQDLSQGGSLFRRPQVTREWSTVITNRRSEAIDMSLRDRIPVSTEAVWWVQAIGDPPNVHGDEGLLRWERPLEPSAEMTVQSGWWVRYPKNNPPGGL